MARHPFLQVMICCLLTGCATTGSAPVELKVTFDAKQVDWFNHPGTNTLDGTAVLRTVGGEARTCAALPIELLPVSTYAEERVTYLYGSPTHGYDPVLWGRHANFKDESLEYKRFQKKTLCDAQGNFEFADLPDGSYFVIANVVWGTGAGGITEGGAIMERVDLHGGEKKRIILTE